MRRSGGARYRPVQGLLRGLGLLSVMNRGSGAGSSPAALARTTGLHRTTVKRLLETLRDAGFVRRLPDDSYRLTFHVRTLSEGFNDEAWVTHIASPLLRELTEQVLWPSDLLTVEGEDLVVRESTHALSPLSFHPGMLGQRVPFFTTAAGRAYLTFCAPAEREALLAMLRKRADPDGAAARNAKATRAMLNGTRERGYAVNEGDWIGGGRFGAIAVPVLRAGAAKACINLIFSKRALSTSQAARRHLGRLKETAAKIGEQMERGDEALTPSTP
jgi:IclR family mhp operon transcriptional activator